jgi:hypothetical protein
MIHWNKNSNGEWTRNLLKKKGIESPRLQGGIKIAKGLTVYPKKQPKDVARFIQEQRIKFKIEQ